MSDARLSSLSVIHDVHKNKEIDFNNVISDFAGKKRQKISSCACKGNLLQFL